MTYDQARKIIDLATELSQHLYAKDHRGDDDYIHIPTSGGAYIAYPADRLYSYIDERIQVMEDELKELVEDCYNGEKREK